MSLEWGAFGYAKVKSQLYKNARRAGLGEALARRVGDKPTLNAGVFALARTAPHWAAWRERLGQALKKGRVFTSDQMALGIIVHADGLPAELMPETCNYMGPLLDLHRRRRDAGGTLSAQRPGRDRAPGRLRPNAPAHGDHRPDPNAGRAHGGAVAPPPRLGSVGACLEARTGGESAVGFRPARSRSGPAPRPPARCRVRRAPGSPTGAPAWPACSRRGWASPKRRG